MGGRAKGVFAVAPNVRTTGATQSLWPLHPLGLGIPGPLIQGDPKRWTWHPSTQDSRSMGLISRYTLAAADRDWALSGTCYAIDFAQRGDALGNEHLAVLS